MVAVRADLQKTELIAIRYLYTDIPQDGIYLLIEDHLSVLSRTGYVVDQNRNIMAFKKR